MASVGRVSIYKSWRLFHIHVSLQEGIFLFRLSGASHLIQVVPPPPPPPVAESGTGARRNGEVQGFENPSTQDSIVRDMVKE